MPNGAARAGSLWNSTWLVRLLRLLGRQANHSGVDVDLILKCILEIA